MIFVALDCQLWSSDTLASAEDSSHNYSYITGFHSPQIMSSYNKMQTSLKQTLLSNYQKLPPKIESFVKFRNKTIRQKDENGQLQKIFMAFAVYVSYRFSRSTKPSAIIVTASHNPPNYNGIKLQQIGKEDITKTSELLEIINNEKEFISFITNHEFHQSQKPIDFFIGRDARPTSLRLSTIVIQTLTLLGNKVIDLGEGSTPEITSVSEFIDKSHNISNLSNIPANKNDYYEMVQTSYRNMIELIHQKTQRPWSRKRIYIDFSNGVGAITYQHYGFLNSYFDFFPTHQSNFDQPNVQCGAKWIYQNRTSIKDLPPFPQADSYVWLDGDADRIIMKLKNEYQLVQGEDMSACFIRLLSQLVKPFAQKLKVTCVGNINTNYGFINYLSYQKIQFQTVPIGMRNLFDAAKQKDICCFFEPNGHGSIYFSETALTIFRQNDQLWQAKILLLIHQFIRNNSRGYAFHVFLLFQLYLYLINSQKVHLFTKSFLMQQEFQITRPQLFVNSTVGSKLLAQPKQLVQKTEFLSQKYPNLLIKIRRSDTSPLIRSSIQGSEEECKQFAEELSKLMECFLSKMPNK